jgi:multicomponent Na+:H+ antiporter subunit C
MDVLHDIVIARFNYWVYVVLMMIGLYAMIAKNNLIKKLIGMSIFQTAIILFFVSLSVKEGAKIPILVHGHGGEHHGAHGEEDAGGAARHADGGGEAGAAPGHGAGAGAIDPDKYANPLPHVLMLTAIVVGVATLGVGLAIAQRVYGHYGTLEEDEILAKIRSADG